MFRSILCATDFSLGARHALDLAAAYAQASGGRLDVLHVVAPFATLAPDTAFLEELRATIRNDAEGKLDALVASLAPGAKPTARLVDGFADAQIVAQARALGSDLVVVGTSGQRSLGAALLGSTANRVVRTSEVPVMAIPREAPASLPRAVVVATDLAPPSKHAVALAGELARSLSAPLSIVLGYELPFFADREAPVTRELPSMLEARVRAFHGLDAAASVHVVEREPADAIAHVVETTRAGLVVMAGGGRGKLAGLLLGSVTDRVLRTSQVPVLVLRAG